MRQTSIDAYHAIEKDGLLGKRQWTVYQMLFEVGPSTGYELTRKFKEKNWLSELGGIHQRLSELERRGVIQIVGEKLNSETKKNNYLWDVTDKLPIKLEKPVKIKCKACDGKGYTVIQQTKFDI